MGTVRLPPLLPRPDRVLAMARPAVLLLFVVTLPNLPLDDVAVPPLVKALPTAPSIRVDMPGIDPAPPLPLAPPPPLPLAVIPPNPGPAHRPRTGGSGASSPRFVLGNVGPVAAPGDPVGVGAVADITTPPAALPPVPTPRFRLPARADVLGEPVVIGMDMDITSPPASVISTPAQGADLLAELARAAQAMRVIASLPAAALPPAATMSATAGAVTDRAAAAGAAAAAGMMAAVGTAAVQGQQFAAVAGSTGRQAAAVASGAVVGGGFGVVRAAAAVLARLAPAAPVVRAVAAANRPATVPPHRPLVRTASVPRPVAALRRVVAGRTLPPPAPRAVMPVASDMPAAGVPGRAIPGRTVLPMAQPAHGLITVVDRGAATLAPGLLSASVLAANAVPVGRLSRMPRLPQAPHPATLAPPALAAASARVAAGAASAPARPGVLAMLVRRIVPAARPRAPHPAGPIRAVVRHLLP
jgi:hypothetical protein